MMSEKFNTTILKETGALKDGHFLLASGLHSEYYFQAQALLQYPCKAERVAANMAKEWNKEDVDTVLSLAVGGIVLGQEVARSLECRHIFLERKNKNFSFRRGFKLEENEKILIVEDVITTGGSVKEAIEVVEKDKPVILGIGALLQRGEIEFNYPFKSLLKVEWPYYKPEECPLCRNGIPLTISGTKQSRLNK